MGFVRFIFGQPFFFFSSVLPLISGSFEKNCQLFLLKWTAIDWPISLPLGYTMIKPNPKWGWEDERSWENAFLFLTIWKLSCSIITNFMRQMWYRNGGKKWNTESCGFSVWKWTPISSPLWDRHSTGSSRVTAIVATINLSHPSDENLQEAGPRENTTQGWVSHKMSVGCEASVVLAPPHSSPHAVAACGAPSD